MDYKEKVMEKINQGSGRVKERSDLWKQISSAYEQGGSTQVSTALTDLVQDIKTSNL